MKKNNYIVTLVFLLILLSQGDAFAVIYTENDSSANGKTVIEASTTEISEDLSVLDNTTLGDANTDTLTINSVLQGTSPLVFEGTIDDANDLTFTVTNPTASRTITFPDASGTVALTSDIGSNVLSLTNSTLTPDNGSGTNLLLGESAGSETTNRLEVTGNALVTGNLTVNTGNILFNDTNAGGRSLIYESTTAGNTALVAESDFNSVGSVRVGGSSSEAASVKFKVNNDAVSVAQNTIVPTMEIARRDEASSVPLDGFGEAINFNLASDGATDTIAAQMRVSWEDVSAGDSAIEFDTDNITTTVPLRIEEAAVGIFNTNPSSTLDVTGSFAASGNIALGDSSADTIATNGRLSTALVPTPSGSIDLGVTASRYRDIYIASAGSIDIGDNGDSGAITYNLGNDAFDFDANNDSSAEISLDANGLITAASLSASSLITPGSAAGGAPTPTAGRGSIYFDSTANVFRVSENGGVYTDLVPSVSTPGFGISGNDSVQTGTGNVLPNSDNSNALGSAILRWQDLFVGPGSIHVASTSAETTTARDWTIGIEEASGSTEGNLQISDGANEYLSVGTDGITRTTQGFSGPNNQVAFGTDFDSNPDGILTNNGGGDTDRVSMVLNGLPLVNLANDGTNTNLTVATPAIFSTSTTINSSLTFGQISAPAAAPTDQGRIYFDQTSDSFLISQNGSSYIPLAGSGSGGLTIDSGNSDVFPTNGENFVVRDAATDDAIRLNNDGSAIFNEQGDVVDFRVESNANPNMLLIDGSADAVAIAGNNVVSGSALTVNGNLATTGVVTGTGGSVDVGTTDGAGFDGLRVINETGFGNRDTVALTLNGTNFISLDNDGGTTELDITAPTQFNGTYVDFIGTSEPALSPAGRARLYYDSTAQALRISEENNSYVDIIGGSVGSFTDVGSIIFPQGNESIYVGTNVTPHITLGNDGAAVFNEQSNDVDFRVESNGNANMLVVDGTSNSVLIGTATPAISMALNVNGRVNATSYELPSGNVGVGNIIETGGQGSDGLGITDGGGGADTVFLSVNNDKKIDISNTAISLTDPTTITGSTFTVEEDAFMQKALRFEGTTQPTVNAGQGVIYYDSTSDALRASQDGGGFVDLVGGTAGTFTDAGSITAPTGGETIGTGNTGSNDAADYKNLIGADGSMIVNNQNDAVGDFTAKSENNNNMLFVDSSLDAVMIGRSTPIQDTVTAGGRVDSDLSIEGLVSSATGFSGPSGTVVFGNFDNNPDGFGFVNGPQPGGFDQDNNDSVFARLNNVNILTIDSDSTDLATNLNVTNDVNVSDDINLEDGLLVSGTADTAMSGTNIAGKGVIYFSSDTGTFKVSQGAGGFVDLVSSGGSGAFTSASATLFPTTGESVGVGSTSVSTLKTVLSNTGTVTINNQQDSDAGDDRGDLIVKTANDANMLFVDASEDAVLIGRTTPIQSTASPAVQSDLSVEGITSSLGGFSGTGGQVAFGNFDDNPDGFGTSNGVANSDTVSMYLNNAPLVNLNTAGLQVVTAAVFDDNIRTGGVFTVDGLVDSGSNPITPSVSASGEGNIYFDSVSNKFRVSENGSTYLDLTTASGTSNELTDPGTFLHPAEITDNLIIGAATEAAATINLNADGTAEFDGDITANADLIFEGATANAFETTFSVVDPTADRTINIPNDPGTLALITSAGALGTTTNPITSIISDGLANVLTVPSGVTSTLATLADIAAVDSQFIDEGDYLRIQDNNGDQNVIVGATRDISGLDGIGIIKDTIAAADSTLFSLERTDNDGSRQIGLNAIFDYRAEDSAGNTDILTTLKFEQLDNASTSEDSRLSISTTTAGTLTETIRLDGFGLGISSGSLYNSANLPTVNSAPLNIASATTSTVSDFRGLTLTHTDNNGSNNALHNGIGFLLEDSGAVVELAGAIDLIHSNNATGATETNMEFVVLDNNTEETNMRIMPDSIDVAGPFRNITSLAEPITFHTENTSGSSILRSIELSRIRSDNGMTTNGGVGMLFSAEDVLNVATDIGAMDARLTNAASGLVDSEIVLSTSLDGSGSTSLTETMAINPETGIRWLTGIMRNANSTLSINPQIFSTNPSSNLQALNITRVHSDGGITANMGSGLAISISDNNLNQTELANLNASLIDATGGSFDSNLEFYTLENNLPVEMLAADSTNGLRVRGGVLSNGIVGGSIDTQIFNTGPSGNLQALNITRVHSDGGITANMGSGLAISIADLNLNQTELASLNASLIDSTSSSFDSNLEFYTLENDLPVEMLAADSTNGLRVRGGALSNGIAGGSMDTQIFNSGTSGILRAMNFTRVHSDGGISNNMGVGTSYRVAGSTLPLSPTEIGRSDAVITNTTSGDSRMTFSTLVGNTMSEIFQIDSNGITILQGGISGGSLGNDDFSNNGEDATANRTIGNNDAFDLGIETGGSTRIHVEGDGGSGVTAGFVGLNTITPSERLTISDPVVGTDTSGTGTGILIDNQGSGFGDAYIKFDTNGTNADFIMGSDEAGALGVNNAFKISRGSSLGTNDAFAIRGDTGNVQIVNDLEAQSDIVMELDSAIRVAGFANSGLKQISGAGGGHAFSSLGNMFFNIDSNNNDSGTTSFIFANDRGDNLTPGSEEIMVTINNSGNLSMLTGDLLLPLNGGGLTESGVSGNNLKFVDDASNSNQDIPVINALASMRINLDANNNDTASNFRIVDGVADGSSGGTELFMVEDDGNATIRGDLFLEGTTIDNFETRLEAGDPTADRIITFPDASGTVALTGSGGFVDNGSEVVLNTIGDNVGIGEATPTNFKLEVKGDDASVFNDTWATNAFQDGLAVLDSDATISIVSDNLGSEGSLINLIEMNTSFQNMWSMMRLTGANGALTFRNGTNSNAGSNPVMAQIETDGDFSVPTGNILFSLDNYVGAGANDNFSVVTGVGDVLQSAGPLYFTIDSNNNVSGDSFIWQADGANGAGTSLMTLSDAALLTLNGNLQFEGSTADNFETTIVATDPTADRTLTFPDLTGEVQIASNGVGLINQVLTSNGPGVAPSWQAASGGGGGSSIFTNDTGFSYVTDTTLNIVVGDSVTSTSSGVVLNADGSGSFSGDVKFGADNLGTFTCSSGDAGKHRHNSNLCQEETCDGREYVDLRTGLSNYFRRIFVSSTTYTGDLGGIDGADAKCQTRADAADLGGKWIALVSNSNRDINKVIAHTANLELVNGTDINTCSLWDNTAISAAINVDELGNTGVTGNVWTGTDNAGALSPNSCNGWTSASSGVNGSPGNAASALATTWVDIADISCDNTARLYCIEVIL